MECPRSLATEGLFCPVALSEVANLQLVARVNGRKSLRVTGGSPLTLVGAVSPVSRTTSS